MSRASWRVVIALSGVCLVGEAAAQTSGTSSAPAAYGRENPARPPMREEKDGADPAIFVAEAAQGGMTEVQLAQMALGKTSNPSVRAFAEKMAKDHGSANMELSAIAKRKRLAVPVALDADHTAIVQKLSAKSGADFDTAYSTQMITDHDKMLTLFADASQSPDSEVATFAQKILPTLKQHREMADSLPSSSHTDDPHESPTQR